MISELEDRIIEIVDFEQQGENILKTKQNEQSLRHRCSYMKKKKKEKRFNIRVIKVPEGKGGKMSWKCIWNTEWKFPIFGKNYNLWTNETEIYDKILTG